MLLQPQIDVETEVHCVFVVVNKYTDIFLDALILFLAATNLLWDFMAFDPPSENANCILSHIDITAHTCFNKNMINFSRQLNITAVK